MQNKRCKTCVCWNIAFVTVMISLIHTSICIQSLKEALDGVDELVEIVTENIVN